MAKRSSGGRVEVNVMKNELVAVDTTLGNSLELRAEAVTSLRFKGESIMTRLSFWLPPSSVVTVEGVHIRNLKVRKDVGRINVPTTSKPSKRSQSGSYGAEQTKTGQIGS